MGLNFLMFLFVFLFWSSARCALGQTANFSARPTSDYSTLKVNLTDLSSGSVTSQFWYFGYEQTSTRPHPVDICTGANCLVSLNGSDDGSVDTYADANYVAAVLSVTNFTLNLTNSFSVQHMVFMTGKAYLDDTCFWSFGDCAFTTTLLPNVKKTERGIK